MGEVGCLKDGCFQNLEVEGKVIWKSATHVHNIKGDLALTNTLVVDGKSTLTGATTLKRPINNEVNVAGAVNTSLTAGDSGTIFNINGVLDNVITLPTVSTGNLGVVYEFFIVTAVASGKTTTVVLPGSVSNFFSQNFLTAGTAANAISDNAGDTFTFVADTVPGSRMRCTCVVDDGTNSTWLLDSNCTPIGTTG